MGRLWRDRLRVHQRAQRKEGGSEYGLHRRGCDHGRGAVSVFG